jgi:alpha-tubulin suppressor-like RCC1 family protein
MTSRAAGPTIFLALWSIGCAGAGAEGSSTTSGDDDAGGSQGTGGTGSGASGSGGAGATTPASGSGGSSGCAEAACDPSCGGPGEPCCRYAESACDTGTMACVSGNCQSCITAVDTGSEHACVIKSDGSLWCWGYNAYDQIVENGVDQQPTPSQVFAAPANVGELHLGNYRTCVRGGDGKLACWGYQWGQSLPLEETFATGEPAVGLNHLCALASTGRVWCWGNGDAGQLGNGLFAYSDDPLEVTALGADNASIDASGDANCVIKNDGSAWCWGSNYDGQLGIGNMDDQSTPVQLSALGNEVESISLTGSTGCALKADGSVSCWGILPLGSTPYTTPKAIAGLPGPASHLAVGRFHACAIAAGDGSVWCWGDNGYGQLGVPQPGQSTKAVEVTAIGTGFVQIASEYQFTCALQADGSVWCWGYNSSGQLGQGHKNEILGAVQVPLSCP